MKVPYGHAQLKTFAKVMFQLFVLTAREIGYGSLRRRATWSKSQLDYEIDGCRRRII